MNIEKDPDLWNALKQSDRIQSSFLSWLLAVFAVGAGSFVTWLAWPADDNYFLYMGALSGGALVFVALFFLAYRFEFKGAGETIRDKDGNIRPFVLYLRGFQSDRGWHGWIGEDLLAKGLKQIGLPVCVGRPGERLPPSGFHRLYFRDEDWQDSVSAMASSATCIVLLMGKTQGLTWELTHILDSRWLTKTILLVPSRKHHKHREALTQHGIFVPSLQCHYPPPYSSVPFDLCPVEFNSPSKYGSAVMLVPEALLLVGPLYYVYWIFYGLTWTITFAIPPLRHCKWLLDRRNIRVDYETTLKPALNHIPTTYRGDGERRERPAGSP